MRALEKHPDARFQNTVQMRKALEKRENVRSILARMCGMLKRKRIRPADLPLPCHERVRFAVAEAIQGQSSVALGA